MWTLTSVANRLAERSSQSDVERERQYAGMNPCHSLSPFLIVCSISSIMQFCMIDTQLELGAGTASFPTTFISKVLHSGTLMDCNTLMR